MWQRLFAILTAFAWLGWSAGAASAEQRLALVIGNSAYESNAPLANPQNDAQAVAQLLNTAGFEVVMAFDLSRDIMKQTIEEFAGRVAEKGNDSCRARLLRRSRPSGRWREFSCAGRRQAHQGRRPCRSRRQARRRDGRAAICSEQDPHRHSRCVPQQSVLGVGCGRPGLAIVDAPAGTIVAYSTAPGTEALDGTGKHSPFAAAFMRTAKQPDLPIEQVFKKVRRLVNDSTDSRQTPWESSSLTADFVFFSSITGQPDTPGAPAAANGGANAPGAAARSGAGLRDAAGHGRRPWLAPGDPGL